MNWVLLGLIFARLLDRGHKKSPSSPLAHKMTPAARDYEGSDRIGMMNRIRTHYLQTARSQVAVN
jgi:hypothetical protein